MNTHKPATKTRNPEKIIVAKNQGSLPIKYTKSVHIPFTPRSGCPLIPPSIDTVYWHWPEIEGILPHLENSVYTPPQTCQYTPCLTQYTQYILARIMTYKESCYKCITSWYFSWPNLKYNDHYTGLIHPAASLYLSYTNRDTDSVRPEEGSLYLLHFMQW